MRRRRGGKKRNVLETFFFFLSPAFSRDSLNHLPKKKKFFFLSLPLFETPASNTGAINCLSSSSFGRGGFLNLLLLSFPPSPPLPRPVNQNRELLSAYVFRGRRKGGREEEGEGGKKNCWRGWWEGGGVGGKLRRRSPFAGGERRDRHATHTHI